MSDLMMGLATGFHDQYGKYSRNAVTLFTQSAASPKGQPVDISRFRDMGTHKVIVYNGSLCHHLMQDYGWGDNAIPYDDMREAIEEVSTKGTGIRTRRLLRPTSRYTSTKNSCASSWPRTT